MASGFVHFIRDYKVLLVSIPALVGLHYGWYHMQFDEDFVHKEQRNDKLAGLIKLHIREETDSSESNTSTSSPPTDIKH